VTGGVVICGRTSPATWLEGAYALDSINALRRRHRRSHEEGLRKQISRLDLQYQCLIAVLP
jgi:hypothetical protein